MTASLSAMLLLDAFFRFSAITLLLMLAFFSWRDARHLLQGRLGAITGISLSAMLINTIPDFYELPYPAEVVAWILHIPNTVFIWWFGLSLFKDDFQLRRVHFSAFAASLTLMLVIQFAISNGYSTLLDISVTLNRALGFSMLGHLAWTALSGRQDDLVEARRRLRLWFTLGVALVTFLILSGETLHYFLTDDEWQPNWFSTLRVMTAWPMIFFGTVMFTRLLPESFLFESVKPVSPPAPQIDPKDTAIHKRLVTAMETDRVYRELGLGIGDLSTRINVPEHQLRALINKGLGYRNFAAFLNQYRLSEAKTALADAEQARTPILTIAMDAGYASLATFNRAFKAEEGVTPSEYREKALLNAAQT